MKTNEALLAEISANPEDDGVRLIFADWLEESGDYDRAEFVRAQVRLGRMELWDDGYTALDVRCCQLERAHPEWLRPLEPFVTRCERFCGERDRPFERGFPGRVKLTPGQFVQHHESLLAETPVREVRFAMDQDSQGLTERPELSRLRGVEFAYVRDPTSARNVLGCLRHCAALRHFGLIGSTLPAQEAGRVFATLVVGGVGSLTIQGTRLPPVIETTFAALPWANLRRLVRIGVSQLDWLRAPWVRQLEDLTIYDTEPNLNPGQTRLLADVLPATAVRRLRLGWWSLDVPGGQALAEAVAKSSVRSLALSQTNLTPDVARALVTPALAARLQALYFSWATLEAEVVGRLLGSRLRVCALDHATIETLAALETAPGLPELVELRLGLVWRLPDDPFADRLGAVFEAGTLPRLVSLSLSDTTPHNGTATTNWDRIALRLANCPALTGLRELQFGTVTRAGALALANSPYLNALQLLNVRVWPQDQEAELALTQRFGSRAFLGIVSREY
jgi:uncharacterized protein (TIGR02996 family)